MMKQKNQEKRKLEAMDDVRLEQATQGDAHAPSYIRTGPL